MGSHIRYINICMPVHMYEQNIISCFYTREFEWKFKYSVKRQVNKLIIYIYIRVFEQKINLLKSILTTINNEYGYRNENNTEKKVKNQVGIFLVIFIPNPRNQLFNNMYFSSIFTAVHFQTFKTLFVWEKKKEKSYRFPQNDYIPFTNFIFKQNLLRIILHKNDRNNLSHVSLGKRYKFN